MILPNPGSGLVGREPLQCPGADGIEGADSGVDAAAVELIGDIKICTRRWPVLGRGPAFLMFL